MEPQNKKMMTKTCLHYFENPVIVELVSASFGDDEQSRRIFKNCLAGETPEDPNKPLPFEKRYPFMDLVANPPLAALKGRLSVLRWLRISWYPMDVSTFTAAARNGHLVCMEWALESGLDQGTFIVSVAMTAAAESGHLDILKWIRETLMCPWFTRTVEAAAKNGHMHCLKWARENGCPWNEDTCHYAALLGHLECLKWARENGCP